MPLGTTTDLQPFATYLTKDQVAQLRKISAETEVPVAALVRRAVREWLERQPKTRKAK